jgi:hypothetical protein
MTTVRVQLGVPTGCEGRGFGGKDRDLGASFVVPDGSDAGTISCLKDQGNVQVRLLLRLPGTPWSAE